MRKKLLWSFLASCLFIGTAIAQNVTINGKVIDEKGDPIAGASVQVKGTRTGANTDANGTFSIKAAKGTTLVVTSVGYEAKSAPASDNLTVRLATESKFLSEVVVTGTGSSVSKRKLAIAVQSISSDKLPSTPSASIDQALVGKIAGAQVTSVSGNPGAPVSIQLRGVNTIQSGSSPMVLVDGVEMGASALNTIDLNSVEKVEVVQGAAAATVYGAQGANGVIQIFTKKGRSGKPQIEFSTRVSQDEYINLGNVHQPLNHSFQVDAAGNVVMKNSAGSLVPLAQDQYGYWGNPFWLAGPNDKNDKPYKGNVQYYDHIAQLFKTAMTTNKNISIAGAKDKVDYAINLSQLNQESIIDGSLNRTNLTANIGVELFKDFKIRSINQLVYTESTIGNTAVSSALYTYPFADFMWKDKDGNHTRKMGGAGANSSNPEYYKQYQAYMSKTVDLIPSINANYKVSKFVDLDYKYSINQYNNDYARNTANQSTNISSAKYNSYTGEGLKGGIYNSISRYTTQNSLTTANLKFDLANDFGFKLPIVSTTTAAYDYRKKKYTSTTNDYVGMPLYPANANQAETKMVLGVYDDLFTTFGYFVNQRFDYGDFGGISAGVRSDYSSTFGDTKQAQSFPRGDAYVRVSSFKFWDKVSSWFNDFKIRGAFGEAGIQPGVFDRIITLNNVNFDNGPAFYNASRVANPMLTVERSRETEIGFDMNFKPSKSNWFSNINLVGTVWSRKGTDVIWVVPLAISSGASEIKTNAVDLSSKGYELSLDASIYKSKNFSWNLSSVYGSSKSYTDAIHGANDIPLVWGSAATYTLRPGEQMGTIYGYKALTQIDQKDATGALYIAAANAGKYEIVNGRVVETASKKVQFTPEKHVLGNTTPDFNMSFTNSFTYKDFLSLSMQVDVVGGAKQYNQTKEWMYSEGLHGDFDKSVTIGGVSAPWTAYYKSFYDASESNGTKDYFLEDASFVRLRNVSLSFDAAKFWKVPFTNKLQFVFSGRNLMTLTKYSGMDPEANQNTTGAGSTGTTQTTVQKGLDYWSFPNTKSYQIGINIGLN